MQFVPIVLPILLALGAYYLGLVAYHKQKEYEHVRSRYLDNGIDLACAQVEYALSVHRANWTLFLRYIKLCRDSPLPFNPSDFFSKFRELDQAHFQTTAMYRVVALMDSQKLWDVYQFVFAEVQGFNEEIKADFGLVVPIIAATPNHPNKQKIIDEANQSAMNMRSKSRRLYTFLSALNEMSQVLEQDLRGRKSAKNFRNHPVAKDIQSRMEMAFEDIWPATAP